MRLRDLLHHELAEAFGLHHEDPLIQQLAGLRRVGAAVYDLQQELESAEGKASGADLRRARCYFAGAETLVTFADAFVLDAFADPSHPRHVARVTFLQAQSFYLRVPDLVTAVRQEIAYPGAASVALPVLPGERMETARCPLEHLLAMQRAAAKVEELIGTRIETLKIHAAAGAEPPGLRPAVLLMAGARSKRDAADQVIGALRKGEGVPPAAHEEAEAFYYDGVLRAYLYAAQELELLGVTASAPATEQKPEPDADRSDEDGFRPRRQWASPVSHGPRPGFGSGLGSGFSGFGSGRGFGLGDLIAADVVANLVGDLLGGIFGGGRW